LICNHVGTSTFLEEALNSAWNSTSDRYAWLNTDPLLQSPSAAAISPTAGYSMTTRTINRDRVLSYLLVLASGHMAPMDQPGNLLRMFQTFLQGSTFNSHFQNISSQSPSEDADNKGNFSLTSLLMAVVGTFIATFLLMSVIMILFYRYSIRRYQVIVETSSLPE